MKKKHGGRRRKKGSKCLHRKEGKELPREKAERLKGFDRDQCQHQKRRKKLLEGQIIQSLDNNKKEKINKKKSQAEIESIRYNQPG